MLQEPGGKERLRAILEPLVRASASSPLIKELLQSRAIYEPLAWDSDQAYAFLTQVPTLEAFGVRVRLPDFWSEKTRRRPLVTVKLGQSAPSQLGLSGLLSFQAAVSLGGVNLTHEEMKQLLKAKKGLALLRGKWIEVDPERLQSLLQSWKLVGKGDASHEGSLTLMDALRVLAANPKPDDEVTDLAQEDDEKGWMQIEAGQWLAEKLKSLKDPDFLSSSEEQIGLQGSLRGYQRRGLCWMKSLYTNYRN